jgi:hypothetical protein
MAFINLHSLRIALSTFFLQQNPENFCTIFTTSELLQLSLAGSVCLGVFAVLASQLKLPEVELLLKRLRQRLAR